MTKEQKDHLYTARWAADAIARLTPASSRPRELADLIGEHVTKALDDVDDFDEEEPDREDTPGRMLYTIPDIVETDVTVKTRGKYRTASGNPLGCVVHYTAGRYAEGKKSAVNTLRYMASQGLGCLVMDTDGVIYKAKNQDFDDVAYHAGKSEWKGKGGVSAYCMGMEICNAGMLTKKQDGYYTWYGDKVPDDEVVHASAKDNIQPGYYHKYTIAQMTSLANFLLWQIDTAGMEIDWIVGHDEVSPGRKQDPGGSHSMTMPELREWLRQQVKA